MFKNCFVDNTIAEEPLLISGTKNNRGAYKFTEPVIFDGPIHTLSKFAMIFYMLYKYPGDSKQDILSKAGISGAFLDGEYRDFWATAEAEGYVAKLSKDWYAPTEKLRDYVEKNILKYV